LGLHISKQIVELLGGQIAIESEVGHGSTFSFEIPWRKADPVSLKWVDTAGNKSVDRTICS
jgi:signal transduction histidine kinase